MNDFVLAFVGSVGIAALVMSMNNEVKEDFTGCALKTTNLKKVSQSSNGTLTELAVDQYPNISQKAASKPNPIKENYSQSRMVGNGLGAKDITTSPYVTPSPNYNQNVNQPSPSLNLPSLIRYNPPSLDKMGITENFQCNKPTRENYVNQTQSCKSVPVPYSSNANANPGPNYSASPLPAPKLNPNTNAPMDGISDAGVLKDPFEGKDVMIFDRPMTTTLKVGRFAGRGTRDLIRGDLPCAPDTHRGWFSSPGNPADLTKGALQVMGGESESTRVMNEFMKIYGDDSNLGSGVNLEDEVSKQYTALDMVTKSSGVAGNTVRVQAF